MRWKKPICGDLRERVVFLWWPLCIDHEVRWLEWARVYYKYRDNSEFAGWKAYGFAAPAEEPTTKAVWSVIAWAAAVAFSVAAVAAKIAGY